MEVFELFNAVIREQSIHSNWHAPSQDIAIGFANTNRVWHFLSGGVFQLRDAPTVSKGLMSRLGIPASSQPLYPTPSLALKKIWTMIGPECLALARMGGIHTNFVAKQLGLEEPEQILAGKLCTLYKFPRCHSHNFSSIGRVRRDGTAVTR